MKSYCQEGEHVLVIRMIGGVWGSIVVWRKEKKNDVTHALDFNSRHG